MKKTIFFAAAALFFSASLMAQSTADSIAAKYKLQSMPDALTLEKTFPVIGTYQLSGMDSASTVTIALDSSNKGMIWVQGLPQGKVKAYLKQSPSTYRILPQKGENGKQIPEGTLIFNKDANTLNIALGAPYKDEDPAGIFTMASDVANSATTPTEPSTVKVKTKSATAKTKTKVMFYNATKVPMQTSAATGGMQQ